jgi:hypothetical protein
MRVAAFALGYSHPFIFSSLGRISMQKKRTIFFASIALLAVGASSGRVYADEPKPIKLPIPGRQDRRIDH